ncbi:hypothetical protein [Actinomadura sp. NPDC000600]
MSQPDAPVSGTSPGKPTSGVMASVGSVVGTYDDAMAGALSGGFKPR